MEVLRAGRARKATMIPDAGFRERDVVEDEPML